MHFLYHCLIWNREERTRCPEKLRNIFLNVLRMLIQHHQVNTILMIKYYQVEHYYGTEWIYLYNPTWNGSCVLKGSAVKCWSIAMFDTLDWHLDQHLIHTLLDQHPGIHRVESWLTFDMCIWVGWQLADLSVDWLLTRHWCQLSVDHRFIKCIDWHLMADTFLQMIQEINTAS